MSNLFLSVVTAQEPFRQLWATLDEPYDRSGVYICFEFSRVLMRNCQRFPPTSLLNQRHIGSYFPPDSLPHFLFITAPGCDNLIPVPSLDFIQYTLHIWVSLFFFGLTASLKAILVGASANNHIRWEITCVMHLCLIWKQKGIHYYNMIYNNLNYIILNPISYY